jgi:hypothetical protein
MLFARWRTYRRLRRAAEISDATAEGDIAKATGIVRVVDDSLRGPHTGRLCVGWRIRMLVGGGDTASRGTFEGSELVRFAIEREDGSRIVIVSSDAQFDLPSTRERGDPPRWAEYCESRGISATHPAEEIAVEPGSLVSVVGIVAVDAEPRPPQAELGYRQEADRALQLTGDYDHPVLIGRKR